MDAAAQGASNAVMMVLNICANLVAFLAFVAFLNGIMSWLGGLVGAPYITFEVRKDWWCFILPYLTLFRQYIIGKCFIPIAWMMGVPAGECDQVGHVVGLKTIVNEFAAYKQLAEYMSQGLVSVHSFSL